MVVSLSLWETLKCPPIALRKDSPSISTSSSLSRMVTSPPDRGEVVQPLKVFEFFVVVDGEVAIYGAELVQTLKKGEVQARNFEVASNGVIALPFLLQRIRVCARAHDAVARQNVAFTIAARGAIYARVFAASGQDEQQDE